MDVDEIKNLIALMRKNKLKEISVEDKDSKIRLVAADPPAPPREFPVFLPSAGISHVAPPAAETPAHSPQTAPSPSEASGGRTLARGAGAKPEAGAAGEGEVPDWRIGEIKAPLVGTFYRAPAPDAPEYVEVGSQIEEDTVLCIIEAMKLMNEIKSDIHGKIVAILVKNGQPVEFNQPMFRVELA